jgi:uncharacterized protein (TIGR00369 family)
MSTTTSLDDHHRGLERMYLAAPTNQRYHNLTLQIGEGSATVGFEVTDDLHHAAGALHGAHLFKLLDDAAFFAANSVVTDVFVLTAQFSVQMLAPVAAGVVRARGRLTRAGSALLFADSVLTADGRELARGQGTFARSRQALATVHGYGSS